VFFLKGISFGAALAMVVSFVVNKSIAWAVFHGVCGWFYIFYYILTYIMHITSPLEFSDVIGIFR